MKLIRCTFDHAEPILEILNDAIINSTALYDYVPRQIDSMAFWFEAKAKNNYPVIGLLDEYDALVAFGTYGSFRAWPAYKYTIEHSLYVHPGHRGKGYGKVILGEIIKEAKAAEYHNIVAGIDSGNEISKRLHEQFGFIFAGTVKHAGYKFSRWLDLDFYQLILSSPAFPVDG
jgi:phosphinothricin acetyltransferase